MKIAYVLPDPGIPVGGTKGASVHVSALCKAMADQGAEVTLFAPTISGEGPAGVKTVQVDIGKVRSGNAGESDRIAGLEVFFEGVREHLSAQRPDVIHERLSLFAGSGTALSHDLGIARQVEVNAPVAQERSAHFGLSNVTEALQAEIAALRAANVLAVSSPLARWALELGASSAVVVPNGAGTTSLDPQLLKDDRKRVRKELGIDDFVTIGFVGSLKPWHGLSILVEAVAKVAKHHRVALLVVGDGPGRASLVEQANTLPSSVKFISTGAVAQNQVAPYLAATDIAVAPYTPVEPFYFSPLKIAEAMAAGLAVVASDFESVRELLGDTGMTVEPGDSEKLAAALSYLVDNPGIRAHLAHNARARAVALLDWQGVARRTLEHAKQCIKQFAPDASATNSDQKANAS